MRPRPSSLQYGVVLADWKGNLPRSVVSAHVAHTSRRSRSRVCRSRRFRGGNMTSPSEESTLTFRAGFSGQTMTADHADYDLLRALWNGAIDRKPALIACCTTAEQVADAIGFARRSGLEIAIRGGGHSHAGNSSCDGGLRPALADERHSTRSSLFHSSFMFLCNRPPSDRGWRGQTPYQVLQRIDKARHNRVHGARSRVL